MPQRPQVNRYSGVLMRLAGDTAGTTLAMMAAAMIPTIVIAGSAIDVTRMYVTKTRLQQACDAGVLAGRKFLLDSAATTLDSNAQAQAQKFFGNNFKAGWMGTTAVSFSPTKTGDNQVAGTASATVPMTIMASFGQTQKVVTTTCEARFDLADADIMFVLDTTGSMSCVPSASATCSGASATYTRGDGTTGYYATEASGSKLQVVRDAVLLFYDTMVANADPSTHIRYGFVPYASSVNVGSQLQQSWLVDSWKYQSRRAVGDSPNGNYTDTTYNNQTLAQCDARVGRSLPANTDDYKFDTNNAATVYTKRSYSGTTCVIRAQPMRPIWRYNQWTQDVSQFKTGAAVQDPTKFSVSLNKWQGCIEERDTTASTTFNAASLPGDLDPDLQPTSDATKWRPSWPEIIYDRSGSYVAAPSDSTGTNTSWGDTNMRQSGYTACGMPAQRLQTMTRGQVSSYVNNVDFKPLGGTYHDVGMIWGTRFLSPTGPFSGDTAPWPGRNSPNRHIIFMSDGSMAPNADIYGLYGMETLDGRVAAGSTGTLTARHNERFKAVCAAAKARNITVWMIAFGVGGVLTPEMQACASPGKAFYVPDGQSLKDKFKEIATQIAELRLSK